MWLMTGASSVGTSTEFGESQGDAGKWDKFNRSFGTYALAFPNPTLEAVGLFSIVPSGQRQVDFHCFQPHCKKALKLGHQEN
jgi:hypothetical protein